MKKFTNAKNDIQTDEISAFEDVKEIIISNYQFKRVFNILVKKNEEIKVNQVLMKDGDGNNILSPISGKVKDISLINFYDGLSYGLTLENDMKFEQIPLNFSINSKEDLINVCKESGLFSYQKPLSKIVEKIDKKLHINAYDNDYIFNQKVIYKNFKKDIEKMLKLVRDICKIEEIVIYTNIENFDLDLQYKQKKKATKKEYLNLLDLKNLQNLLEGKRPLNLVSVTGGALNKSLVVDTILGTKIDDIIDFMGGFKEDILEIENFKFTALSAFNDFEIMRKKLKETKNQEDVQKLEALLLEKEQEAQSKLFDKLPIFHQKYLNCLSACFFNGKSKKMSTKNLNLPLQKEIFGLHLVNNEQFN